MVNVADLMITSLDTITAYGMDGTPRFILDELQGAKIANTEEKTDITGKQGRKLSSLKKNKAVTVTGTNGIVSAGLIEAQTGCVFKVNETAPVAFTDYLTVTGNEATTTYTAVGTVGAEIAALYIIDDEGVATKKLEQATTAAEGKFAYTAATKKIAFAEDEVADGTRIAVFYTRAVNGTVIENVSDNYSEKVRMYIDVTVEDKCANAYHGQFYIQKADFSGNFDFDMGGDQTVHAFEAVSLAGGCGGNNALWTFTVFGVE